MQTVQNVEPDQAIPQSQGSEMQTDITDKQLGSIQSRVDLILLSATDCLKQAHMSDKILGKVDQWVVNKPKPRKYILQGNSSLLRFWWDFPRLRLMDCVLYTKNKLKNEQV